jgi:hypothetical protein|nr:MAG TPA: hypothetical protein [Caudoviricetes sp.]
MIKLHVVVYKSFADIPEALTSQIDNYLSKLFIMCELGDYERPKKLSFKDGTIIYKSRDKVVVFVKHDLPAKQVGMLEYYIYQATGMRGEHIKIDSLEVFEKPNTPLKKYLVRKL